jgi:hypothetical protein
VTRDQAAAAIADMPEVARIERATLLPSDVIVIETGLHLTQRTVERLREICAEVWPGQKVVVLDAGLSMKIVQGTEKAQDAQG